MIGPGFFGKLPERADFVAAGLAESFLAPFDEWLQAGMVQGVAELGDGWAGRFAQGPCWCFSLAAGVAGPDPMVGLLLPSRDRSGRSYPFVMGMAMPKRQGPASAAACCAAWYERSVELAKAVIQGTVQLSELPPMLARLPLPSIFTPGGLRRLERGVRLDGAGHLAAALPQLLDGIVPMALPSYWWSLGGGAVDARSLLLDGLPKPDQFVGMFRP